LLRGWGIHEDDVNITGRRHPEGRAPVPMDHSGTPGRFEQFDWVLVRIEQLNLFSARSTDDVTSEAEAAIFHRCNERWKLAHGEYKSVPSARFLQLAIRHRTGS